MTSSHLESLIEQYSETHLVCDSSHPLITNTTLEEEALLYNLDKSSLHIIMDKFGSLTGKEITDSFDINTLSGGQKVVLMVLLALYCSAQNIVFIDLEVSLDALRLKSILALFEDTKPHKREILLQGIS